MFRFRCRSGISDYENILKAIFFIKMVSFLHFSVNCVSISFYIHYKMGRLRFACRLSSIKYNCLLTKL